MTYQLLNFRRHPAAAPSTLLATCDICLDDKITICGAKLVRRKAGGTTFLALPTRKANNKYIPEVLLLDKSLQAHISKEFDALWQQSKG